MFERKPEDMIARVYISERDCRDVDASGVTLWIGYSDISYAAAKRLVFQMKHVRPSVPKSRLRRFDSIINQLRNAFGPDMWADTLNGD